MLTTSKILITLSGVPELQLFRYTHKLKVDLSRTGIKSNDTSDTALPGRRGDALSISQIAIALSGSSAVVALISCLRSYIERDKKLIIEIRGKDGKNLKISSENIDASDIISFMEKFDTTAQKATL